MDRDRTIKRLREWQRDVVRTVRTATFGAERPRRHVANFLRRGAEAIEPRQADVRVVVPEEGPRDVDFEGGGHGELHSQRDSANSESRGSRPERHNSGINPE